MQAITLLGSTGSIGTRALSVIAMHPDRYRVLALSAHARTDALVQQCLEFKPAYAVLSQPDEAERASRALRAAGCECKVLYGQEGLREVATLPEADVVVAGIVGAAGLPSALAAVRAGATGEAAVSMPSSTNAVRSRRPNGSSPSRPAKAARPPRREIWAEATAAGPPGATSREVARSFSSGAG